MIDTIHAKIPYPAKRDVVDGLTDYRHTAYQNGQYHESGQLRNLRVTATHEAVKVRGSLAAFKNGSNVVPFCFEDVKPALDELAQMLGLPFEAILDATVSRLDVGANLDMEQPVSAYLRALADPYQMTHRNYRDETATFKGNGLTLNYYDKVAETRRNHPNLAPLVAGRNLLRYEAQFKGRLHNRFGREVKVEALLDPGFQHRLRMELVNQHEQRAGRLVPVMKEQVGVRRLNTELARLGVEAAGGEEQVLAMIAETHLKQAKNRTQRARLVRHVRGLGAQGGLIHMSDAMNELTEAIKAAVR